MVMMLATLGLVQVEVVARKMTIAAVFDEGGGRRHELAFRHAVQAINRNRWEVPLARIFLCLVECEVVGKNSQIVANLAILTLHANFLQSHL